MTLFTSPLSSLLILLPLHGLLIGVDVNRLLPLLAFASLPSLSVRPRSATRSSRQCSVAALGTSIGEVAALVALPPGIALSPGCIVGTVGAKSRDPSVVLRPRTSCRSRGLPPSSSSLDVPWLGYSQPPLLARLWRPPLQLLPTAALGREVMALHCRLGLRPRLGTPDVIQRRSSNGPLHAFLGWIGLPRRGCVFSVPGFSFLCGYSFASPGWCLRSGPPCCFLPMFFLS